MKLYANIVAFLFSVTSYTILPMDLPQIPINKPLFLPPLAIPGELWKINEKEPAKFNFIKASKIAVEWAIHGMPRGKKAVDSGFYISIQTLPQDQQKIILSLIFSGETAKSLEEATKTIRSLSLVNKYLNQLINHPGFCLQIIKHLAKRFNCSDMTVCEKLNTPQSNIIEELHKTLLVLCSSAYFLPAADFADQINELMEAGVDLNFTFDDTKQETPLIVTIQNSLCSLARVLLIKGANPECPNKAGRTPVELAKNKMNSLLSGEEKTCWQKLSEEIERLISKNKKK